MRDDRRLKVFLSFAGKDRPLAEELRDKLTGLDVDAYIDEHEISLGENVVLAINDALSTSDYYVLLWSANTSDRRWVGIEWSAAFAEELARRRAFLFIVRLDEAPLPPLLAPRKHIDAPDAADRLVATWRADQALGTPVFPQPTPPAPDGRLTEVRVRNRDLGITHVVMVPADGSLNDAVHAALALPDEETLFNGKVGMRFYYRLMRAGTPLPARSAALLELADGAVVDLEVLVEPFGPTGSFGVKKYRAAEREGLNPAQTRLLITAAFDHLRP